MTTPVLAPCKQGGSFCSLSATETDHRYSHGFLFPSHVERIKQSVMSHIEAASRNYSSSPIQHTILGPGLPTPSSWAHSSVSTFGTKYQVPTQDLTIPESVEALVEGSDMSKLHEGSRGESLLSNDVTDSTGQALQQTSDMPGAIEKGLSRAIETNGLVALSSCILSRSICGSWRQH